MCPAIAQPGPPLVGTYSTSLKAAYNRDRKKSIELVIEAVDGDVITAKGTQYGGDCAGSYVLEGRRENDHLIFRVKTQDARAGCTLDLDLVPEGDALVGTRNRQKIRLSR